MFLGGGGGGGGCKKEYSLYTRDNDENYGRPLGILTDITKSMSGIWTQYLWNKKLKSFH